VDISIAAAGNGIAMKRTDDTAPARDPARDPSRDPWRAFVNVAQIPEGGLHREIEADAPARAAMAEDAAVREISSARAMFDLSHRSGGRIHVAGRVQAKVGQTCVVTLEPIENEIDEEVDLIFAPADVIAAQADVGDDDGKSAMAEPPEPIENGMIDLGRLATDALYLAIDPYPRKDGAVFEPQVASHDPEDHPFAALKTLQDKPDQPAPAPGGRKGK
jgi:uncharacterized metal-binding protein YceD (DUF177 family)